MRTRPCLLRWWIAVTDIAPKSMLARLGTENSVTQTPVALEAVELQQVLNLKSKKMTYFPPPSSLLVFSSLSVKQRASRTEAYRLSGK